MQMIATKAPTTISKSLMAQSASKDKRPNIGSAVCRHQDRKTVTHVPFDFFCVLLCFFAMALLLECALPSPKQWRITNERRMNQLGQQGCSGGSRTNIAKLSELLCQKR